MKLIKVTDRYPKKAKYYRVLCVNGKFYKCKFVPEENGPLVYSSAYFKHSKRALNALAWVDK